MSHRHLRKVCKTTLDFCRILARTFLPNYKPVHVNQPFNYAQGWVMNICLKICDHVITRADFGSRFSKTGINTDGSSTLTKRKDAVSVIMIILTYTLIFYDLCFQVCSANFYFQCLNVFNAQMDCLIDGSPQLIIESRQTKNNACDM